MWMLRWLTSGKVRQAVELRQQVQKYLDAQRDLLKPDAVEAIRAALASFDRDLRDGRPAQLKAATEALEKVANERLKPYPHAAWRENVEMLLVVGAVVMAFRAFFFQPMAIPSGSAQPTLWGITQENLRGRPDAVVPSGLKRFYLSWVKGEKYFHFTTKRGGTFQIIDDEPKTLFPFVKRQRFRVGDETFTAWSPPERLFGYGAASAVYPGQTFQPGEDVIKLRVTAGDHLFVNRVTYNFRQPHRGEIIVFESPGYDGMIKETHYIKRLVALGDERVRIGNDRHLVINGNRLDASTPHFENVYSFNGPPRRDIFSGHVNGAVAAQNGQPGLASLFKTEATEFVVRHNHYLTMGDNTMNSADSRDWGDFPRNLVIGKLGFVFWPISDRFGWAAR